MASIPSSDCAARCDEEVEQPGLSLKLRKSCDYCVRMKRGCDGRTPCELCRRRKKDCVRSVKKRSGPAKGTKYCTKKNSKNGKTVRPPTKPGRPGAYRDGAALDAAHAHSHSRASSPLAKDVENFTTAPLACATGLPERQEDGVPRAPRRASAVPPQDRESRRFLSVTTSWGLDRAPASQAAESMQISRGAVRNGPSAQWRETPDGITYSNDSGNERGQIPSTKLGGTGTFVRSYYTSEASRPTFAPSAEQDKRDRSGDFAANSMDAHLAATTMQPRGGSAGDFTSHDATAMRSSPNIWAVTGNLGARVYSQVARGDYVCGPGQMRSDRTMSGARALLNPAQPYDSAAVFHNAGVGVCASAMDTHRHAPTTALWPHNAGVPSSIVELRDLLLDRVPHVRPPDIAGRGTAL